MNNYVTASYEGNKFKVKALNCGDYEYQGVLIGRHLRPRGNGFLYNVEMDGKELSSGHETIGAACISIHQTLNINLKAKNGY